MKKILKNIFKPFLFVCLGLIATITFASNLFGPPGKPGKPEATAVMADGCVIKYTAPTSDGGSPILGYYIEIRDKYSRWETVNKDSVNTLDFVVCGMIKGNTVEFRAIATNKAGRGKPSDASDPITF